MTHCSCVLTSVVSSTIMAKGLLIAISQRIRFAITRSSSFCMSLLVYLLFFSRDDIMIKCAKQVEKLWSISWVRDEPWSERPWWARCLKALKIWRKLARFLLLSSAIWLLRCSPMSFVVAGGVMTFSTASVKIMTRRLVMATKNTSSILPILEPSLEKCLISKITSQLASRNSLQVCVAEHTLGGVIQVQPWLLVKLCSLERSSCNI